MSTMNVQRSYWQELMQLKFELCYLDEYKGRTERINNAIQMFSAIASSASIGGWAIWNQIGYVWAGIIAASQVVTAIKTYLPYNRRVRSINETYNQLSLLFLKAEHDWFQVASGDITESQIHDMRFDLKRERQTIMNKALSSQSLPLRQKVKRIADRQTETYFANFYK
jgi:hypothetical protein